MAWNGPPGGYPPQGGGYPPQGGGYPPQGGYPPAQGGYPPQQGGYPPQPYGGPAYPPQAQGAPAPYGGPPPGAPYGGPPPGGAPPYGGPPPGGAAPYGGGAPPQAYGGAPPGGYGPPGGQGGYGGPAPGQAGGYGGPPPQAHHVQAHCKQGRKKAVLVGINYIHGDPRSKLNGCINDARNLRQFLIDHFRFPAQSIRILTDDQPTSSQDYPSKANLVAAMKWLIQDVQVGDSLFFHFSGHGGQKKDKYHLEDDGLNETILPADYAQAGEIIDDKMHKIMVKPLKEGMQFTAIFDSCHSGTALDLPFLYKAKSKKYKNAHKQKGDNFWSRHKVSLKDVPLSVTGIAGTAASHVTNEVSHHTKKGIRSKINKALNSSKAHVVMLSGCRDDQTSADTAAGGEACGAMSYAFRTALTQYQTQLTYEQLLQSMREILHDGPKAYSQIPQLSYANEEMDMGSVFSL